MPIYDEKILDNSVWMTATPPPAALTLPFCVTEAGHFHTLSDYAVSREMHDSHLILFTINGCGTALSEDNIIRLPKNHAAVIDCRKPHRYAAEDGEWEFIWLHIKGSAAQTFYELLNPNGLRGVEVYEAVELREKAEEIIAGIKKNDMVNAAMLSACLHDIYNLLLSSTMKNERERNFGRDYEYVKKAEKEIRLRYGEQLSIDDIIENIPISKYHFIRTFKRIMGTTPYHFLTSIRINNAKILLRTTDISVTEIAQSSGFLDTSNFIAQFKRNTGQKPLQYRRYFAAE